MAIERQEKISQCEVCKNAEIDFYNYLYNGKVINICIDCKSKEDKRIKKNMMSLNDRIIFEKREKKLRKWRDF